MRWLYVVCLVAIQAMAPVAWSQDRTKAEDRLGGGIVRLADDHPDCDCEKCECATTDICRAKACGKRYLVLFTTAGCAPCETAKATFAALKKSGYLVFIADDPRAAEHWGVRGFPVIVLMDGRKEVKRWKGPATFGELSKELKVAKPEEKPAKPVKPDYRLW